MFLKYMKKYHKRDDWSECLLIESQLSFKLSQSDKLCANHRYTLGVGYKPSKKCQHPQHRPEIGKKAHATRSAPVSRCISIAEKYNMLFLIESVLRCNHMKNENKMDKDEPPDTHLTQDDPDYETPEPVISENNVNISKAGVADLAETLNMSWIKFQIKNKKMTELRKGKKYIKKKYT